MKLMIDQMILLIGKLLISCFDKYLDATAINDDKLDSIIKDLNLDEKDENSIRTFVVVLSLIAQASAIKKLVQKIVNEYHS